MKHNLSLFAYISVFATPIFADTTYAIPNMVGKIPLKICWFIKKLSEPFDEDTQKTFPNRLLLYGPPGNGKTTLARKMAEESNSLFFTLNAPGIVTKYIGSGSESVQSFFANVRAELINYNHMQRAIVFIDEIDAIAANVSSEYRSEHKSALQQLWLELDNCKNDGRIFVIFATNHFEKLSKTFLDRFGSNIIKIDNPSSQTRRDALLLYFQQHNIVITESLLNQLVNKTKGLSVRSLEDLTEEISMLADIHNNGAPTEPMLWQALKDTRSKFERNKSTENDPHEKERELQYTLNKLSLISSSIAIIGGLISIVLHTGDIRKKYLPTEKETEREQLQDEGLLLNVLQLRKNLHLHENKTLVAAIENSILFKGNTRIAAIANDLRSHQDTLRESLQDENSLLSAFLSRKNLKLHENKKLCDLLSSLLTTQPSTSLYADIRSKHEAFRDELASAIVTKQVDRETFYALFKIFYPEDVQLKK